MKTTLVAFALRPWRASQHWTQAQAAAALGLSLSAYRAAEYRSDDRGTCSKTLALLATDIQANARLGKWMAAALDDPAVCWDMKADIRFWFSAFAQISAGPL